MQQKRIEEARMNNLFNLQIQEEERGGSVEEVRDSLNKKDISELNSLLVIGENIDGGVYLGYCVDNNFKIIGMLEQLKKDLMED